MNPEDVRNVARQEKPKVEQKGVMEEDRGDTAERSARCIPPYALLAGKLLKCLSNPPVTNLYTAGTAINPGKEAVGKNKTFQRDKYCLEIFIISGFAQADGCQNGTKTYGSK